MKQRKGFMGLALILSALIMVVGGVYFMRSEEPKETGLKGKTRSAGSDIHRDAIGANKQASPRAPDKVFPMTPELPPSQGAQNPLESDPKFKERIERDLLNQISRKTANDLASARFFQSMTEERKRELIDAAARKEADFMHEVSTRAERGEIVSRADFQQLRAEGEEAVRSLLTADEYSQYTEHLESAPDRNLLSQVNSQLAFPVDEETSNQLLEIFADERRALFQTSPPPPEELGSAIQAMGGRIQARVSELNLSSQVQEVLQTTLQDLSMPKGKPNRMPGE